MLELGKSALVYTPTWIFGHWLCDRFGLDAYWVGWMLGATAFYFRLYGPKFIRAMP